MGVKKGDQGGISFPDIVQKPNSPSIPLFQRGKIRTTPKFAKVEALITFKGQKESFPIPNPYRSQARQPMPPHPGGRS